MIAGHVSPHAEIYHLERFMGYMADGHDEDRAEELADLDLIEWSKPIEIPDDIWAEVVQDEPGFNVD